MSSLLENVKEILKNKKFWINYFILLVLYSTSTLFNENFTKGFNGIFSGKGVKYGLVIVIGFFTICVLQVFLDLIFLYPFNWFYNKYTDTKNVIYYYLSVPSLFLQIEFFILMQRYHLDEIDLVIIPTFLSVIFFSIIKRKEFKKISTWILSLINLISSLLFYTFLFTAHVLILAFLAVRLFELKKYLNI